MILLAARSASSFLWCLKTILLANFSQISLFQFFQFLCFITHSHSHTQTEVKSALLNGGTSKMRGGEGCIVELPHYSCALSRGSHFGGDRHRGRHLKLKSLRTLWNGEDPQQLLPCGLQGRMPIEAAFRRHRLYSQRGRMRPSSSYTNQHKSTSTK